MPLPSPAHRHARHAGFTLLEVLMAVGVIAILMAIIIPAITGAQNSAKRAKTRVQFSQWSAAIEQFRQEYGYYPNWGTTNADDSFANGLINTSAKTQRFVECLSGRRVDGTPLQPSDPGLSAGNTKRITFATFGEGDLTSGANPQLQDAFGNTQIVVLMDKNLSGAITFGEEPRDYAPVNIQTNVQSIGGETVTVPITSGTIIRAGVAFYSAGDGKRPVTSW